MLRVFCKHRVTVVGLWGWGWILQSVWNSSFDSHIRRTALVKNYSLTLYGWITGMANDENTDRRNNLHRHHFVLLVVKHVRPSNFVDRFWLFSLWLTPLFSLSALLAFPEHLWPSFLTNKLWYCCEFVFCGLCVCLVYVFTFLIYVGVGVKGYSVLFSRRNRQQDEWGLAGNAPCADGPKGAYMSRCTIPISYNKSSWGASANVLHAI